MTDLSSLGAASLGIWTRADALTLLTPGEIDTLVRTHVWQTPWRGVYTDGGCDLSAEQRALAACLASGGAGQPFPYGPPNPVTGKRRRRLRAVAAGRTAARVYRLPLIDDHDPATGAAEHLFDDVAVHRHLSTLTSAGRTLHRRQLRLTSGELVRRPGGLWVTSPVRTLVDCAGLLTHEALVCALDNALHREPDLLPKLVLAADRHRAVGAPALRRGLAVVDGRAESAAETLARLILLPVLPGLRPQVRLFDHAARLVARFDLGDEEIRLAVESDGQAGHAGERMPRTSTATSARSRPAGQPNGQPGTTCVAARTSSGHGSWPRTPGSGPTATRLHDHQGITVRHAPACRRQPPDDHGQRAGQTERGLGKGAAPTVSSTSRSRRAAAPRRCRRPPAGTGRRAVAGSAAAGSRRRARRPRR